MIYHRGKQLINHFWLEFLHGAFTSIITSHSIIGNRSLWENLLDLQQDSYERRIIICETGRNMKEMRRQLRIRRILRKDDGSCSKKERGRMGPNINRVETDASLARWTRNADQYTAIMHRMRRNITVIRRGFAFFVVLEHFLSADVKLKNVFRISFETHVSRDASSISRNSRTRFYILYFFFFKKD